MITKSNFSFFKVLLIAACAVLAFIPEVYAVETASESLRITSSTGNANSNVLVDTMCRFLAMATGNAGKAFAAFAIITVGIGFFTGKISWGLMLGVAAGIALMFGAPTIVAVITGKSAYSCEASS